jgi:hypothetical protein
VPDPAGFDNGQLWSQARLVGGPTTSGSTASGSEKASVCPARSGRSPAAALDAPSGMCLIPPGGLLAMDFQFDQTSDGKRLKMYKVVDQFTRGALACDVKGFIDADVVLRRLGRLTKDRGA